MRRILMVIAGLLTLLILFVPAYIGWLTWGGADASAPDGLLIHNTKDSTRLAGPDPSNVSQAVTRALFPVGNDTAPDGVLLAPADSWQAGVAAAPLVRWANGPLLLVGGPEVDQEIERLQPAGISPLEGATVIRVGLDDAPATGAENAVPRGNPAEMAASADALVETLAGEPWPNILLVPDDPAYAIPAAYWAAQSGDVILFGGDPLPDATRQALERRGGQARLFLLGLTLDTDDLSQYGEVHRIVAGDGAAAAVALAEYRDTAAGVGWGLDGGRYLTNHNYVLANLDAPETALAGLALARFGKFGPLLWVHAEALPPVTEQYLWKMKPEFFNTPAEGPFNHLWVLGGPEQVSLSVQGQADLSQEIGAYRFEEAGLSGMEVLWVVWIVAGAACATWLLLHSLRRLPQLSTMMRASWTLLALVSGPLAVWLYRRSYHRVPWMRHGQMAMWHRQGLGSALAASAMNRGFDGPLMLAISWIATALGLPLLVFRGPGFWLGNSMMVGIFIAYFGALLLHWLLMHAHMFMEHEQLPYGQAVRRAFPPAFFSMTAMAVGMMGFMWWIQMINLMMEGMPESDDIMWWGTTLESIVVGWVVALPVDDWLVRRQMQPGTM